MNKYLSFLIVSIFLLITGCKPDSGGKKKAKDIVSRFASTLNNKKEKMLITVVKNSSGNVTTTPQTKIPILLYHSWTSTGCEYQNNVQLAFAQDLETLLENGFTIVPIRQIAEWNQNLRDSFPGKVVGITIDDGDDHDWVDGLKTPAECPELNKSFGTILKEFKARHAGLQLNSPLVTNFVIASPVARHYTCKGACNDSWWKEAQDSGLMEIQNHGVDHDSTSILSKVYDPELSVFLPVAGYVDGDFVGRGNFLRIKNFESSRIEVVVAGNFIQSKIQKFPDLFAYPFGHASDYLEHEFFEKQKSIHNTFAAVCTTMDYVTKKSPSYCLPRFSYGSGMWRSKTQLLNILNGSEPETTSQDSSACNDWQASQVLSYDNNGNQLGKVCGCIPPEANNPLYWINEGNGCYSHRTGNILAACTDWQSIEVLSYDTSGKQHGRVCGCQPPLANDPNYWTKEGNGCYSHLTGKSR